MNDVTLLNGSQSCLDPDTLRRLDGLYAYYHRQWWCRRQMFYHYKLYYNLFNLVALLIVAVSVVVGAVWEDSWIMIGLTASVTVVKGWNEFRNFSLKTDMCRFAYTTHEKTLIELRTYVRGFPFDEFEGFLSKLQTLEDTITEWAPPVYDRVTKHYGLKFIHRPAVHKNVTTDV